MVTRWLTLLVLTVATATSVPWRAVCTSPCVDRCCTHTADGPVNATHKSCCAPTSDDPAASCCCAPPAETPTPSCCDAERTDRCDAAAPEPSHAVCCCMLGPIVPCDGCDFLRFLPWAPWKGDSQLAIESLAAASTFPALLPAPQSPPRARALPLIYAPDKPPWTPHGPALLSRICLLTI